MRRAGKALACGLALATAACGSNSGSSTSVDRSAPEASRTTDLSLTVPPVEDSVELVVVEGNDVGLPRPVNADGDVAISVEAVQCSLTMIGAYEVVRTLVGDRTQQLRETSGADMRLIDVWAADVMSDAPDAAITELATSAGTSLIELWSTGTPEATEFVAFGVPIANRPHQLDVTAVGHAEAGQFVFDWPCPEILNSEFALAAELTGRPADDQLASELMLVRDGDESVRELLDAAFSDTQSGAAALAAWTSTPPADRDISVLRTIPVIEKDRFRPLVVRLRPEGDHVGQVRVASSEGISYLGDFGIEGDLVLAIPRVADVVVSLLGSDGGEVASEVLVAGGQATDAVEIGVLPGSLTVDDSGAVADRITDSLPEGVDLDAYAAPWFDDFFFEV